MVEASRQAHFRGYGTSFSVLASDDDVMAAARCRASLLGWRGSPRGSADVQYVLRRITRRSAVPSTEYTLICDGDRVRTTTDFDGLIDAFEDHAKLQTAARAHGVLFVHAGAVAWQGRGILIPGRSRAGKSTLVRALLSAGAEYYSDEFALLDADGRVHPYALPLSLRGKGTAPSQRIAAESLGAPTATCPVFVDLIVATHYRRRARWQPRPIPKGEALLVLMENTVAARQPPERTMPILRQAVLRATALRSDRGEAQAAARRLIASVS